MKVVQQNSAQDVLTALAKDKSAGTQDRSGFKDLLGELLQEAGQATTPTPAKPEKKPELTEANSEKPQQKTEEKPDDATVAAAVVQTQSEAAEPQTQVDEAGAGEETVVRGTGEISAVETTSYQTAQVEPEQIQTVETLPDEPGLPQAVDKGESENDILSMEVLTQAPVKEPTAPNIPLELQSRLKTDDSERLGVMLEQAQDKLQELTAQSETTATVESAEPPVTLEAAEPAEETRVAKEDAHVLENESPEAKIPEAKAPEGKTETDPTAKTEAELQKPDKKVQNTPEEVTKTSAEGKAAVSSTESERTAPESKTESKRTETPEPKAEQVQAAETHEPLRTEALRQPEPAKPERPVYQPDQTEQVRMQVIENLERENMEFRMQLQPESLGKVDVRMVLQDGRLTVDILAANPKAAELLREQSEGLMQSLRLQQLEVQTVNVVTQSQSSSGEMGGAFTAQGGHTGDNQQSAPGRTMPRQSGGESESVEDGQEQTPESLLNYAV